MENRARQNIKAFLQDPFDGVIVGIVMIQRSTASCFQTFGPVLLFKRQCGLSCPQIVQHLMGKQSVNEFPAGNANLF